MSKAIRSVTTIEPLPTPYGSVSLSAEIEGTNNAGKVRLEVIDASEAACGVSCVRVTPIAGGVNKKILEIPMTSVLCIEPKQVDAAKGGVTMKRLAREE